MFKFDKINNEYILTEDYSIKLNFQVKDVELFFCSIKNNILTIKEGYRWNGCNIIIDTKANMRAGCVHDCLYSLLQLHILDWKYRKYIDLLFRKIWLEDGNTIIDYIRSTYSYIGLFIFGGIYLKYK